MIEAVVWDIGRVLVQWSQRALYEKLIADPAERAWFLANVVTEEWHFRHDAGEPLAALIAERIARFPRQRTLIEAYADRWLDTIPGPVEGTHALVEQIAARGLPQYSITNFGADTWAMFRPTLPLLDHFRDIVVSGHERMLKPDPAIFRLAERRFGHDPAAMLFIDDNAANVAAARDCGWRAHHFVSAPPLVAELHEAGLID